MTFTRTIAEKGALILACSALALTACTNVSGSDGSAQPNSSGTSAAQFDPTTVQKDNLLAEQVPAPIRSKGTLIVGSDTAYAPAEFLGGSDGHTPMGYDVDLAKAIGATLGLEVDVMPADFSGILSSLGPKYDLGISSYTITKERLEAVNFVSYLNAGSSWAVQKGNPKNFSIDHICGKTIGVQTGSTQEAPDLKDKNAKCSAAGNEPINIISLKDQADVTTRLVNGSLDAMVADSPLIDYAIQQTGGVVQKIGDTYNAAPQGIAVAKGDTALADLVQKVMTKLISDGTYKKIFEIWGVSDGAIIKSEVNPAEAS